MPRALRVQYPGAVYHIMDRGDRQERIFLDDVDRQDWLKTLAETCHVHLNPVRAGLIGKDDRLVAYPWSSLVWYLAARLKNDPGKLAIAERLRKETTLSVKWIARRVQLGTPKSARAMLHQWLQRPPTPAKPESCAQLQFQPLV